MTDDDIGGEAVLVIPPTWVVMIIPLCGRCYGNCC